MISIDVHLFTILRHRPDGQIRGRLVLELQNSATVADVLRELDVPDDLPIIISVNHEQASPAALLRDGDQVELIPAIAGGCHVMSDPHAMKLEKIFPTWEEIEVLAERLAQQLAGDYDVVLVVTRAGVFPASFLTERLGLRNITATSVVFYTEMGETLPEPRFLNFPEDGALRGKRVLIIDEVWDSGQTMTAVRQRVCRAGGHPEVAVLHYKPTHSIVDGVPDYWAAETDKWVVYPWDPNRQAMLERIADR